MVSNMHGKEHQNRKMIMWTIPSHRTLVAIIAVDFRVLLCYAMLCPKCVLHAITSCVGAHSFFFEVRLPLINALSRENNKQLKAPQTAGTCLTMDAPDAAKCRGGPRLRQRAPGAPGQPRDGVRRWSRRGGPEAARRWTKVLEA